MDWLISLCLRIMYLSLGADGYGPRVRALKSLDEEKCARIIFEDAEQSISQTCQEMNWQILYLFEMAISVIGLALDMADSAQNPR